jgi:hypothetical protein
MFSMDSVKKCNKLNNFLVFSIRIYNIYIIQNQKKKECLMEFLDLEPNLEICNSQGKSGGKSYPDPEQIGTVALDPQNGSIYI